MRKPLLFRRRLSGVAFRRLCEAREGVAAVEFALLLPLMVTLYLGCAELTNGIMASRKMSIVARTLSDLVSQQGANTNMTDATMNSIWGAASAIMSPYSTSTLQMSVSAVQFAANSTTPAPATVSNGYEAKVRWSVSPTSTSYSGTNNGGTTRSCAKLTPVANSSHPSSTTLASGLYTSGSMIIADVTYNYTPAFGGSLLAWSSSSSSITLTDSTYMRPRNSTGSCNSNGDSWICYPTQQTGTCATY